MLKIILIASLAVFFTACSTRTTHVYVEPQTQTPKYIPENENWITDALYVEYKKWHHTPYKYGGLDFDGVDCSSLIQQIYKNAFNIKIPRTTDEQAQIGYKVEQNDIREGDFVFFKTAWNTLHAGIVIEQRKFIHASKKYGVTISHLSNPYWRGTYWQSRRLLP
jgi:lipoprotein Spr/probable lipoprotein NlpC